MASDRDRDERGRPRNLRPRDALGRPMDRGTAGAIEEEELPDDPDELLRIGVEHFNAGRYFQAHEAWETAWHASPGAERDFWQGITQVAVGFTHHGRGNATGAVTLLRRGAAKIEPYGERFHGFPAADVAAAARRAADRIERDGVETDVDPPELRLDS